MSELRIKAHDVAYLHQRIGEANAAADAIRKSWVNGERSEYEHLRELSASLCGIEIAALRIFDEAVIPASVEEAT